MVKCNVPIRGWMNGIGGCPNVGGICMACTMPGFPDKYMPFVEPDAAARLYARTAQTRARSRWSGILRERRIRRTFDVEPKWRRPGAELTSGYTAALRDGCRSAGDGRLQVCVLRAQARTPKRRRRSSTSCSTCATASTSTPSLDTG